jgi:formamidopyrimidine-DNA glycosylase
VIVNTSAHKFAFFFDDPARYPDRLFHKKFLKSEAIAGFVQISCDNLRLLFHDGVEYTLPCRRESSSAQKHHCISN